MMGMFKGRENLALAAVVTLVTMLMDGAPDASGDGDEGKPKAAS
jgi:hypothetical protein